MAVSLPCRPVETLIAPGPVLGEHARTACSFCVLSGRRLTRRRFPNRTIPTRNTPCIPCRAPFLTGRDRLILVRIRQSRRIPPIETLPDFSQRNVLRPVRGNLGRIVCPASGWRLQMASRRKPSRTDRQASDTTGTRLKWNSTCVRWPEPVPLRESN